MEIAEEKVGSVSVVSLGGRIDGLVAPDVEKRLSGIVERGDSHVLLDCAGMSYISSAGLRAVLSSARQCQQAGGKLTLCALQPACKTVFEISGFLSIIDYHDTRDSAITSES
jgi:anti-anti-sigma factor